MRADYGRCVNFRKYGTKYNHTSMDSDLPKCNVDSAIMCVMRRSGKMVVFYIFNNSAGDQSLIILSARHMIWIN